MMTLEQLAAATTVERIVGKKPTRRWNKSSPTLKRSDGHSRETWFGEHSPKVRGRLVQDFMLNGEEWEPLLRFYVSKEGKPGMRAIDMPTILGQAVQYVIHEWLQGEVEQRLSKWSIAYRPRQKFSVNVRRVHKLVQARPWVQAFDVENFFGSIRWDRLDGLVDSLNADDALKSLLCRLWRVPILSGTKRCPVGPEGQGIAQGLVLSPALANLYTNQCDQHVNHVVSRQRSTIVRYSDDLLAASESERAAERVGPILTDRLRQLGLRVTMGPIVNVQRDPIEWLGLEFHTDHIDIPDAVIERKLSNWSYSANQGLLSPEGLEESVEGLLGHYRSLLPPRRLEGIEHRLRSGIEDTQFITPLPGKEARLLQRLRASG